MSVNVIKADALRVGCCLACERHLAPNHEVVLDHVYHPVVFQVEIGQGVQVRLCPMCLAKLVEIAQRQLSGIKGGKCG